MEPELAEAVRAARSGAFAWDVATGSIHGDAFVRDLVGVRPDDLTARLAAATAEVLERGGHYRHHHRLVGDDGSVRRIEERGEVRLGADGRPARVVGLLLDRTADGPDRAADAFLLTITRALSRAATVADVMAVLTDIARPALDAETLLVHLTPTGDVEEIGSTPLHEPAPERLHPLRPPAAAALRRAIAQERPVFVEGISAPPPAEPLTRSWAVLPLAASDRRIGGCIFGYPGIRHFDERQRSAFTALSGIAAHALGRALLQDAEHTRAAELQRAMLPRRTPRIAGHTVAVRYRPGTAGMEVGGDWYEVLELDEDRVGLVIGDVQGHSARASGVMGQLRIALRAFAREGHDPSEVMARTGRLLADLDTGLFATCCYLSLEPATGRLLAARAGHPLPVLLDASGLPRELDLPGGPPLGVDAGAAYPLSEHRLAPGEGLLLYTDGLIEDRTEDYDRSVAGLLATLRQDGPSAPVDTGWEGLADRLVRARPAPGRVQDDLALLLVRRD